MDRPWQFKWTLSVECICTPAVKVRHPSDMPLFKLHLEYMYLSHPNLNLENVRRYLAQLTEFYVKQYVKVTLFHRCEHLRCKQLN